MLRCSISWMVGACLIAASPVAVVAQSVDEQKCREIIEQASNNARTYFELANCLAEQGKLQEAIKNYRQAIQIYPEYADAYLNLGVALDRQGKLQEAIDNYRQALQIDPREAMSYNNLGYALQQQGKLQGAIENYHQALLLEAKYVTAYNNLGNALKQQGKLKKAIEKYNRALDIDPDFAEAQINLDEALRLLANQGKSQSTGSNDSKSSSNEERLISIFRSTVKIVANGFQGDSIGTGWVIKREEDTAWLVSNRHVISKGNEPFTPLSNDIEVEFYSERENHRNPGYQATVVEASNASSGIDLAVLKVTAIPEDVKPLNVQLDQVPRLTEVTIVGHPYNVEGDWNAVSGEVTNYSPETSILTIDATLAKGNSGGPIVTSKSNQVIGLITKIRNSSDVELDPNQPSPSLGSTVATSGVGLAYHIDLVWEKLREWGILQE